MSATMQLHALARHWSHRSGIGLTGQHGHRRQEVEYPPAQKCVLAADVDPAVRRICRDCFESSRVSE
eukprot:scaffold13348_cov157-Isochrysis_galbana.AAC.1